MPLPALMWLPMAYFPGSPLEQVRALNEWRRARDARRRLDAYLGDF